MDKAKVAQRLRQSEGCVAHMYLCTGGKVTVGVGHAIETPADAAKLKWQLSGREATGAEIQADYQKVRTATQGLIASSYAKLTACRLTAESIADLLADDIARFEQQLVKAFPKWNTYPECVQEALFDMAFNVGIGGLKKFKKLLDAVNRGDWEAASAECNRKGIGDERNVETATLFRQAGVPGVPGQPAESGEIKA